MLARARGRGRGGMLAERWHAHDRSSKCILIPDAWGDGVTLCRCVYEHARATTKEAARLRDAMLKRGNRPRTPHAFARPPLLLYTRHTSA